MMMMITVTMELECKRGTVWKKGVSLMGEGGKGSEKIKAHAHTNTHTCAYVCMKIA
jgi:hypothetical protein